LLQHDLPGGVLIQNVSKGSPADKAGLRGGIIPARINGQDILLGGDLILELGDQQACHNECLVDAHKHLQGMNQIRVKYLRRGKIMETTIDVSTSRRKFID
jgi:S1-C subfamily serine protease